VAASIYLPDVEPVSRGEAYRSRLARREGVTYPGVYSIWPRATLSAQ